MRFEGGLLTSTSRPATSTGASPPSITGVPGSTSLSSTGRKSPLPLLICGSLSFRLGGPFRYARRRRAPAKTAPDPCVISPQNPRADCPASLVNRQPLPRLHFADAHVGMQPRHARQPCRQPPVQALEILRVAADDAQQIIRLPR